MNRLLIYTDQSTNRMTYIFDFILGDLMGLEYEFTQDRERFSNHDGAKFTYAKDPIGDELFFESTAILFEKDVTLQPLDFIAYERIVGFYMVSERSLIPFDIFASAFFMITCYNEYLLNKKDKYDRYRASQSMNYKAGFLEKPMINYYALELKRILGARFPQLKVKRDKFKYTATFDVDIAYSYLEKGSSVNIGGFIRSLLLSDFSSIKSRYRVLFRGAKDPFDNYGYIFDVCRRHNIETLFFFLLADRSRFDKNIPHTNEKFRELIKRVAEKTETGIHLSYRSHISNGVMKKEIQRLEEITGKTPVRNRFHYLRFIIPATYLRLIKIGIQEDYSFGYASRVGFRGGTCHPFYFFNLIRNEKTDLKIIPFAFMDSTLTHYNRLEPEEGLEKIMQLMRYVKEVGGPFVGLWHNSSFCEEHEWKGWRNVFETVASEAAAIMQQEEQ